MPDEIAGLECDGCGYFLCLRCCAYVALSCGKDVVTVLPWLAMPGRNELAISCNSLILHRALKFSNIQFPHFEHGLHRFWILDQIQKPRGYDLP